MMLGVVPDNTTKQIVSDRYSVAGQVLSIVTFTKNGATLCVTFAKDCFGCVRATQASHGTNLRKTVVSVLPVCLVPVIHSVACRLMLKLFHKEKKN